MRKLNVGKITFVYDTQKFNKLNKFRNVIVMGVVHKGDFFPHLTIFVRNLVFSHFILIQYKIPAFLWLSCYFGFLWRLILLRFFLIFKLFKIFNEDSPRNKFWFVVHFVVHWNIIFTKHRWIHTFEIPAVDHVMCWGIKIINLFNHWVEVKFFEQKWPFIVTTKNG